MNACGTVANDVVVRPEHLLEAACRGTCLAEGAFSGVLRLGTVVVEGRSGDNGHDGVLEEIARVGVDDEAKVVPFAAHVDRVREPVAHVRPPRTGRDVDGQPHGANGAVVHAAHGAPLELAHARVWAARIVEDDEELAPDHEAEETPVVGSEASVRVEDETWVHA